MIKTGRSISLAETCYCWSLRKHCYSTTCINTVSKLFQPQNIVPKTVETKVDDVLCISHKLMMDQGVIRHAGVGSFHLLPLGVRALRKLTRIASREMQSLGAQRVKLPFLTPGELWRRTGRWEAAGPELFRVRDRHSRDYVLSPTHEEAVTELVASVQLSHRSLPLRLYQVTSKFRDEMKPRLGLLRSREFLMKDLYTFDASPESARRTYHDVCRAYDNIFTAVGIRYVRVEGEQGLMGGSLSHEYHYPAAVGEDELVLCPACSYAANAQVGGGGARCPRCGHEGVSREPAIEVGHTFLLGARYSEPLGARCLAPDGRPVALQMGCYGVGLTRLLAAAVECLSSPDELRWPLAIAPFSVCILPPKDGSKESVALDLSHKLYDALNSTGVLSDDVLMDDRCQLTIGRRLMDARKTGYPLVVVVGKKAALEQPLLEVHDLLRDQTLDLCLSDAVRYLTGKICDVAGP
ncbi:probable proline--tRNA ligase, mitochondrial [Bacillus rossius redtenbacheri]|uniref:probable proline--tRNA ligase, mitochondrial n=1 Tax=Bacillus rossius redtenbacheri TaxID=93214 RepID=UPI002FDD5298